MTHQLAAVLRQLRKARSLTLEQAAQRASLSRSALTRWENGVNQPRLTELNALLTALDATEAQRYQVLALVDAPRARTKQHELLVQVGENAGIGSLPVGGDLLRALRQRRGFSTEQTAAMVGVTVRTLQRWEKGEVWPDSDLLHRLCYALKTQEKELVALTCGPFRSGSAVFTPMASLDALEAQSRLLRNRCRSREGILADLEFLSLIARVWPLAAQSIAGRDLLGRIYYDYATYLYDRRRHAEALTYAERAVETRPEESRRLDAVLLAANAIAARETTYAAEQALRSLRHETIPAAHPSIGAWLQASRASHLAQAGAIEESLQLSYEACQIAQEASEAEVARRQADLANRMMQAGRPAEALPLLANLLEQDAASHVYFRCNLLEAQTMACLQVGDSDGAHTSLQHLYDLITEYDLVFHRPLAKELAQQV